MIGKMHRVQSQAFELVLDSLLSYMGVSKNRGFSPQIIHFNRVFHYFHHPFWGSPIVGNTHIMPCVCLVKPHTKVACLLVQALGTAIFGVQVTALSTLAVTFLSTKKGHGIHLKP